MATAPAPYRMDDVSEQRLAEILPALANRMRQVAQILANENIAIRVVQGLRSWSQQDALYLKGRDAQGNVIDRSAIVTNVKGGYSWHCFGMAVDCAPSVNRIEQEYAPDWNPKHPSWQRMETVGMGLGLASGSTWRTFKDYPHFQLVGRFSVNPDDEVRQIFKCEGMEAIWAEADIV